MKQKNQITDAELVLMKVLWERSPLSAADLILAVEEQSWSETTVKTLLARMVKKGVISAEPEGRRFLYAPLVNRETYTLDESRSFSEKLLQGLSVPLFAQFLSHAKLSKSEIDELRVLLEKKEHE